ncbi:hypothetical protein [Leptolyngbya sp. 7M]|uniref:Uncharacterized protein n=1 Tax=Leptolyngbya sp. NK1-12 TaxID=2547451 RepID=A0AA96WDF5_9CYAN|nr:hypothetical protein [Leptolyngbya sp. 7M]MBF2046139.1 hypothetical protein [Elainella sp. C42_A2020_010]QYO62461.1 hypothetical protein JVX88_20545 [Leptolyngbya sp. 7M]RNJ67979.1 MAG: hypothetical protein EDM05_17550 [Leptolyngbya sp. IPPAS B-1204]WNZ23164.1 hypothetical protein HJG54_10065 [Leptolyngbya sp. NK1-12]
METLAYLHGAENLEQSEAKELNLGSLKAVVTTGLIAAGVTAGVTALDATTNSASAYGYGRGCCRRVVVRPCYYPRHYYAYPVYYRPCRSGCYY